MARTNLSIRSRIRDASWCCDDSADILILIGWWSDVQIQRDCWSNGRNWIILHTKPFSLAKNNIPSNNTIQEHYDSLDLIRNNRQISGFARDHAKSNFRADHCISKWNGRSYAENWTRIFRQGRGWRRGARGEEDHRSTAWQKGPMQCERMIEPEN
jgi:hypothetical protein